VKKDDMVGNFVKIRGDMCLRRAQISVHPELIPAQEFEELTTKDRIPVRSSAHQGGEGRHGGRVRD